jgi:1-acyl-sn-glycerol-3-phosphate acyltransferase
LYSHWQDNNQRMSGLPQPADGDGELPAADQAGIESKRKTGVLSILYGIYAWLAFLVCVIGAVLSAMLLPGLARRRRWVTRFARMPFFLAGIRTTVNGAEHLPDSPCVVVANHASYLDGVILQAFLPPRFSYVIKGEVRNVPVVHFFLRRIGAHFVERFAASAGARDARTLLRAADGGESLAFFPEGTFTAEPGLAAFRAGAFAAAQRAAIPVVPVVIRGARSILPAARLLPRHGTLAIDILPPFPVDDSITSKELAELARQRILAVLAEPDLVLRRRQATG